VVVLLCGVNRKPFSPLKKYLPPFAFITFTTSTSRNIRLHFSSLSLGQSDIMNMVIVVGWGPWSTLEDGEIKELYAF
jgi:hypothetical protein